MKTTEKTEFEKKLEAELAKEEASAAKAADEAEVPEEGDEEAVDAEVVEDESEALSVLAKERDDAKDQMLRLRAEFDNYRKRTARESEQMRKRAAQSLVSDLLPVVDHLELALQHVDDESGGFIEGVQMVLKQFQDALAKHNVTAIAATGEAFDPNLHEALTQAPSAEYDEGVVAQEFQKGYMMGDTVLRHAKVVVSAGAPEETDK